MQTFAQYALAATILVSALGAAALCAVLFFYGFRGDDDEGPSPARRLFVMRLGHAIAAACFAAALMLGSVALLEQRRITAPVAPSMATPATDEVERLEVRVQSLEARLAATELRLGDAAQQLSAVESRSATAPPASRPVKRAALSAREPIVPSKNTSASDDLGASFREDWRALEQGFRQVGDDVRSSFVAFGRRLKKTFD